MVGRSLDALNTKICINGDLGSGKTTAARALAEALGYEFFSTGLIQRELADSLGISILELNKRSENDRSIDDRIDDRLRALANDPRKLVIDSRMGWHFIPSAMKIRMVCHPRTSAARVLNDQIRNAENYASADEAIENIKARRDSERERFFNLYGVRIDDFNNYDLIVQTDCLTLQQVIEQILTRAAQQSVTTLILSPRLIFPLDRINDVDCGEHGSPNDPLEVIYSNDCFFASADSLTRVIRTNQTTIVARLCELPTDVDATEFIRSNGSLARIQEWGNEFPFYPEPLR